jgi:cytochrome c-550 PedF
VEENNMRHLGHTRLLCAIAVTAIVAIETGRVAAHGNVAPQAVDTSNLPDLGEEWLEENPWRDPSNPNWTAAIETGASGYNQNCARCHGLEVISGGLAPDLRYLEADIDGDEWFLERFQGGYTQNGVTKMPAFGELLGQKAGWAIKTYIETRPDEDALDDYSDRLKAIRDELKAFADEGKTLSDIASEAALLQKEMSDIADKIQTGSGAPRADSVAARAAAILAAPDGDLGKAAEVLTIGLSAAK